MNEPVHVDLDGLRSEVTRAATAATGRIGFAIRVQDTDEVLGRDADVRFPAASIGKLAILLAVLTDVDRADLGLDDMVELDRARDVGGFGVLIEVPSVGRLRVRELLALMIAFSDNTASNACIDLVGLARIADVLQENGLRDTAVQRHLMDFGAEARGLRNEISPYDALRLTELLVLGPALSPPLRTYADELLRRQRIRDRLAGRLPSGVTIGNKTGELEGVRHDVGVLRGRATAFVSVLTSGFTDERSRDFVDGGDASSLIAEIGRLVGERIR